MADFSYATDIAPLRSQFFPVGGMSRLEKRQLDTRYAKEIDPLDAKRREMQVNMLKLQEQEVSFEMQKMQLEEAKRTARMKLETETRLPSLMSDLDVINNPALDTATKATEVGKLNMKYAAIAPYDPRVSTLLQAANNQVTTLNNIDENKSRKAALEEQKRTALLSTAIQLGETKVAQNIAESDGISPMEQSFIDLAKGQETRAKTKSDLQQQELKRAAEENIRKGQLDLYKTYESRLQSLGALTKDGDLPTTIGGANADGTPAAAQTFALNPANRVQLEAMMLQLNPALTLEQVKESSAEDLYRSTVLKVHQGLKQNTPSIPTISPILKGFGS
jgi:hypothetical protein